MPLETDSVIAGSVDGKKRGRTTETTSQIRPGPNIPIGSSSQIPAESEMVAGSGTHVPAAGAMLQHLWSKLNLHLRPTLEVETRRPLIRRSQGEWYHLEGRARIQIKGTPSFPSFPLHVKNPTCTALLLRPDAGERSRRRCRAGACRAGRSGHREARTTRAGCLCWRAGRGTRAGRCARSSR